MRKSRMIERWLVPATFGLLLASLALSGQACPGQKGAGPQPTRLGRPVPRRVNVRPAPVRPLPPTPRGNLEETIQRTRAAVNRRDWAAADREAASLGDAWRPIRAGRRWSTADLAAFETAYAKLRTAIKARDQAAADRALTQMARVAQRRR